jgi:hypothetical protein
MRTLILLLVAVILGSPTGSPAAVLVYRGTFLQSQAVANGNTIKTKNILIVFDNVTLNGVTIAWFKDGLGKHTEFVTYNPLVILNVGPSLATSTVFYCEARSTSMTGEFSYTTKALSGRDRQVILRRDPQLLATVPKVLTGTETLVSNFSTGIFRTRRFRVELDLKATQNALAEVKTSTEVRDDFIASLVEKGYPQPESPGF